MSFHDDLDESIRSHTLDASDDRIMCTLIVCTAELTEMVAMLIGQMAPARRHPGLTQDQAIARLEVIQSALEDV